MDPDESPGDQGSEETAARIPVSSKCETICSTASRCPNERCGAPPGWSAGPCANPPRCWCREPFATRKPTTSSCSRCWTSWRKTWRASTGRRSRGRRRRSRTSWPADGRQLHRIGRDGHGPSLAHDAAGHRQRHRLRDASVLQELAEDLQKQGVIDESSTVHNVDDLLEAVAGAAKTTATAFDTPPLSVEGLRQTVEQTRAAVRAIDPQSHAPSEIRRLWNDIHSVAADQGVNPFAISTP